MKPRLLDLFCGAGGAAMGYHRAGFEVVGVDIVPQPNYPFEFHQMHALSIPIDGFDAIHASPPCQTWTAYRRRGDGVGADYMDLIGPVRSRLWGSGVPYVIENIHGAPLINAVQLCGSSFGLNVRRHRRFECSFPVMVPPCAHGQHTGRYPAATNRGENSRRSVEIGVWRIPLETQRAAMGIDWMTLEELSEAIPPAYTEHIGGYLMQAVMAKAA
jgi:DNA (cytosine-5)-methyltransferase 1